jgi:hypothetical protein
MAWFLNKYHCQDCDISWEDEWSCTCDDECPVCGHSIEPEDSDDLTVVLDGCEVHVSQPDAEDDPNYLTFYFTNPEEAAAFASSHL